MTALGTRTTNQVAVGPPPAGRLIADPLLCPASALRLFGRSPERSRFTALRRYCAYIADKPVFPPGLVSPAGQVGPCWCGFFNAIENLRYVHLIVVQSRVPVGLVRVTVTAVLGTRSVADLAFIRHPMPGGAGLFEKILQQIDRIVQKVGVVGANVDMQFALHLRAERVPLPLQLGVEVIVFP